jgi:hypothetical protein
MKYVEFLLKELYYEMVVGMLGSFSLAGTQA